MALTEQTGLPEISTLRRQSLGLRMVMALVGAGLAAGLLGDAKPFVWIGVVIAMQAADSMFFSWIGARSQPVSNYLMWVLRVWCVLASSAVTAIGVILWLQGSVTGKVAAATIWGSFIFRSASEANGRRDLALAMIGPHAVAMLVVPWLWPSGGGNGLFEKDLVLCAQIILLANTVFFIRRQEAQAKRIEAISAAARLSASSMRTLFDHETLRANLLDRELRYVVISKAFCSRTGLCEEDVLGKFYLDILPDLPDALRKAHDGALTGKTTIVPEEEIRWPDGRLTYSRIEVSPWRDDAGDIQGICVFGTDITPFVRERADKEAASTRLALALHNLNAAVWELDVSGKQVIGGDRLGEVFGTRPTYQDMAEMTPCTVHPDYRDQLLRAIQNSTRTGERYSMEYPLISASGGVRWTHTNGEIFTDERGKLARIVALSMDITDRKRAEIDLVETMRRAEKSLFEKRALLFAITRDIGGDGAREGSPREVRAIESLAPSAGFEELYQRLDRLLEEIDARDHALADAVNALREARQIADNANVSKSNFLANMSHELRTPLNAVIGYAEILEEDLANAALETSSKDAARIRVAARHLLTLINEILDLSKIEAGKMELTPDDIDIISLIRETIDTVKPTATAHHNTVELVIENEIGIVRADPLRVRQCLLNLLSNACKFAEHGLVTICLRRSEDSEGRWLGIDVIDTGIGMNEAQLARVFQPFMQADSSTTRKFGGTGLGLALTRRLAQLMGGEILVSSAPNHGSTFTLKLPYEPGGLVAKRGADTGRRPLVLMIEADARVREQARHILTSLAYDVQFAETALDGLGAIKADRPSLVLLAGQLPDGQAWDVLAQIRETWDALAVIIVSAEDDRAQAQALGAAEHLATPLDRDALAAAAIRYTMTPRHGDESNLMRA